MLDLTSADAAGTLLNNADVYKGAAILTPHAQDIFKEKILIFIKERLNALRENLERDEETIPGELTRASTLLNDALDDATSSQLPKIQVLENNPEWIAALDAFKHWYEEQNVMFKDLALDQKMDNPLYITLYAYKKLIVSHSLSQKLSGFHDALLMRKKTRQFRINDPLGFTAYRDFADALDHAVGDWTRSAPAPNQAFNPIRSGVLKLNQLRLVDTFGRVQSVDISDVGASDHMLHPAGRNRVALPPRLLTPVRLNFRWLSAAHSLQESNSHPATTPICGWLAPNNFDGSLMVYDQAGTALGWIDRQGRWRSAPGRSEYMAPERITNPYFRRTVLFLLDRGPNFMASFMNGLNRVQEQIDPENFAEHQQLALLMGRPLAVVRAALNLEQKGEHAIDHHWPIFRSDVKHGYRETRDYEYVQFPIRLGEYRQFNDGLVGYWEESFDGHFESPLYLNASLESEAETAPDGIVYNVDESAHRLQSVDSRAQRFTLMMDPRGKIHATCGIVPVKDIHIPKEHYTPALENIEMTFLSAPVLGDRSQIQLPLPDEPGYRWSWLQHRDDGWERTDQDDIVPAGSRADFSGRQIIRDGWLQLSKTKSQQNQEVEE